MKVRKFSDLVVAAVKDGRVTEPLAMEAGKQVLRYHGLDASKKLISCASQAFAQLSTDGRLIREDDKWRCATQRELERSLGRRTRRKPAQRQGTRPSYRRPRYMPLAKAS